MFFEPVEHQRVDPRSNARLASRRLFRNRRVSPVLRPFRTRLDPRLDLGDFARAWPLVFFQRRHDVVFIGGLQTRDDRAQAGIARRDGDGAALERLERRLF